MATKTIKLTDNRQGATFRTGINGRFFDVPLNTEIQADDALIDHLKGIGARFDEVETKGASSSKEGSGVGLAPIGPHDVISAGTAVKSLNDRPLAGDQPGDVTDGGGAGADVKYADPVTLGHVIMEDAKASDTRVAAERSAPKDASVAEKAGEGEGGTPKAKPQSPEPSHKASASERKASKPKRAKRTRKTADQARADQTVGGAEQEVPVA